MSPQLVRKLHYSAAVAWLAAIPFVLLFGLQNSLPFVAAVSLYDIVVNHWTAGMTMRVEVELKENE